MKMIAFVVEEKEREAARGTRDQMYDLVSAARLDHRHHYDTCNAPLEAFSRREDSRPPAAAGAWRCVPCGGTVALASSSDIEKRPGL